MLRLIKLKGIVNLKVTAASVHNVLNGTMVMTAATQLQASAAKEVGRLALSAWCCLAVAVICWKCCLWSDQSSLLTVCIAALALTVAASTDGRTMQSIAIRTASRETIGSARHRDSLLDKTANSLRRTVEASRCTISGLAHWASSMHRQPRRLPSLEGQRSRIALRRSIL